MREIVLDTETTGMDPFQGDRLVEIGAVELINHLPTGKTLQIYINPERTEATAVQHHQCYDGQANLFECYTEFLDSIGTDSKLVIHNAEFDMKFLNYQLEHVGHKPLSWNRVIDSLLMAREKFPGSPANLDALCRRYNIDNTSRTYHGALLDSELLAEVYLELLGGRQRGLELTDDQLGGTSAGGHATSNKDRPYRTPRAHSAKPEELAARQAFLSELNDPLWEKL